MANTVQRVTIVAVTAALVSLLTTASFADIDATGRWVLRGYVVVQPVVIENWTQTGTALTTSSGYAGTIDPITGTFSSTRPGAICPDDTRTGTVSADGLSLTGFELLHPTFTPTTCFSGVGQAITGSRCPSGTIEAGEECDDGNVFDGDGCDNTCAVESCWSCSGEPSTCTLVPNCLPVCPNGVVEAGETCDDGNGFDGDGCDHTCAVETCWGCAGTPSACSPLPTGTACDANDGVACTINGACDDAHQCIETPADYICSDGIPCTTDVCDPMLGCLHAPNCDDGNPCTTDACIFNCTHTPILRQDCRTALSSKLNFTDGLGDHDTLTWTWTRGQSTSQQDFSDPQNGASYQLCVFAGAANATIAAATLPSDASRWQPTAKGFKYKDRAAAAAGIARVKLIASATDHAKIGLKGKGAGLNVAALPFALPITAQLTNAQSNVCWTATYDAADVQQNDAAKLRLHTTGP